MELDPGVDRADIVHVCYPFQVPDFVGTTASYIARFDPRCTIVHSTVAPGTTRAITEASGGAVVYYSPVRGKHAAMEEHLQQYTKFVSGPDGDFDAVREHLEEAGLRVERMEPTDALEAAKLLETTYFGVLIAWVQEAERFAKAVGSDYATVSRFVEEVPFLPSGYFPGKIGGHCVMPNIEILSSVRSSGILDFVKSSNQRYVEEGVSE